MLSSASDYVLSGRRNFESCCEEEPVAGHGEFCALLSPLVGNLSTFKGVGLEGGRAAKEEEGHSVAPPPVTYLLSPDSLPKPPQLCQRGRRASRQVAAFAWPPCALPATLLAVHHPWPLGPLLMAVASAAPGSTFSKQLLFSLLVSNLRRIREIGMLSPASSCQLGLESESWQQGKASKRAGETDVRRIWRGVEGLGTSDGEE